jgi:hypothetical protein
MRSRLNDRLKHLEAKILPKGRVLVFFSFDEPDLRSYDGGSPPSKPRGASARATRSPR